MEIVGNHASLQAVVTAQYQEARFSVRTTGLPEHGGQSGPMSVIQTIQKLKRKRRKLMGHTPGPWSIKSAPHSVTHDRLRIESAEVIVASMWGDTIGPAGKNGRLVSAAPDLLDALQNLIDRNLVRDENGEHMDQAKEAIAKATGEIR